MATTNHTQQWQSVVYIIALHNDRSLPRDEFITIINSLKQSTQKKKKKIFKSIHSVRVCHALYCTVQRVEGVQKEAEHWTKRGSPIFSFFFFFFSFFLFFTCSSSSSRSRRVFGHSPFWPAKLLLSLPILKRLPATNSESAAACYAFGLFFVCEPQQQVGYTKESRASSFREERERESPPLGGSAGGISWIYRNLSLSLYVVPPTYYTRSHCTCPSLISFQNKCTVCTHRIVAAAAAATTTTMNRIWCSLLAVRIKFKSSQSWISEFFFL